MKMRMPSVGFKALVPGALATVLMAAPASAMTISASFGNNGGTFSSSEQTTIQKAVDDIANLFSDNINVKILFEMDSLSGYAGQSMSTVYYHSYSAYTGWLSNDSTAHPTNATLASAVANLGSGNDAGGGTQIRATSANLRALGVLGASGGVSGTYDGQVTLGTSYVTDVNVIQHEVDEVLGIGGSGSTLNSTGGGTSPSSYGPLDLYRYSLDSGVVAPSYTTSSSATSYFSVDGGNTDIAGFNQEQRTSVAADYGDLVACYIQSAYTCTPSYTYNVNSVESQMLQAIGYDAIAVATTPLPPALPLFISGIGGLALLGWRKKRGAAAAGA